MSPNCPLCAFETRHILCEEGPVSAALYPPDAVRPGHLLVYPTAHREGFTALTEEEAEGIFRLGRKLALAMESITGAEKTYLVAIGDVNPHFHLHLLPKLPGDASIGPFVMGPEGWRSKIHQPASEEAAQEFMAQLRQTLLHQKLEA